MAGEEVTETAIVPFPFPFHGDLLENIISHLPTSDLPSSRHVSPWWAAAVSSYLRHCPRLDPWLVLHLQPRCSRDSSSSSCASVAYDPRSRSWVPLPPPRAVPTPIRSSHSQLLYRLSSSSLSLSPSALAATWTHLPPPRVRRYSPVVALVGTLAVAAGGVCDAAETPRAVEVCRIPIPNAPGDHWRTCDPFPAELSESASATWLSVATSATHLHVLERCSGAYSSFDPESGKWSRTSVLKPDPQTRLSAIGYAGARMVLVGLAGVSPNPLRLTLWEVEVGSLECREIGRMPADMVGRLVGKGYGWPSTVGFAAAGGRGYFCNCFEFGEAFTYEFGEGRWESIGRPREVEEDPTARILFGCSSVAMEDVDKVFGRRTGN